MVALNATVPLYSFKIQSELVKLYNKIQSLISSPLPVIQHIYLKAEMKKAQNTNE